MWADSLLCFIHAKRVLPTGRASASLRGAPPHPRGTTLPSMNGGGGLEGGGGGVVVVVLGCAYS